jgi:sec-independent protein translocase protein TatA
MDLLHSVTLSIAGTEWIIIVLLAIVLLFGTKKLPQVSRSIGKAVGEFEKAKEMFRKEMQDATQEAKSSSMPRITAPVSSEREKLETLADSLGIDDHAGLTDEELRALISKRLAT